MQKLDVLLAEGRGSDGSGEAHRTCTARRRRSSWTAPLWFPVHNQVQTIAYRAGKQGYHFARASWIALFYDVTKA